MPGAGVARLAKGASASEPRMPGPDKCTDAGASRARPRRPVCRGPGDGHVPAAAKSPGSSAGLGVGCACGPPARCLAGAGELYEFKILKLRILRFGLVRGLLAEAFRIS